MEIGEGQLVDTIIASFLEFESIRISGGLMCKFMSIYLHLILNIILGWPSNRSRSRHLLLSRFGCTADILEMEKGGHKSRGSGHNRADGSKRDWGCRPGTQQIRHNFNLEDQEQEHGSLSDKVLDKSTGGKWFQFQNHRRTPLQLLTHA